MSKTAELTQLHHWSTLHEVRNWDDIFQWFNRECGGDINETTSNWVFRGHVNTGWAIKTSLERAFEDFGIDEDDRHAIEYGLLKRFKREANLYLSRVPDDDNIMEWLSLMQHHGAPTRLLDWTHSLFVALYFALSDFSAKDSRQGCEVWALNLRWVHKMLQKRLGEPLFRILSQDKNLTSADTFERLFQKDLPFICDVKPYRFNERMVIQQGVFICPGNIHMTFEENLMRFAGEEGKAELKKNLVRFRIRNLTVRRDFLQRLFRMNMTPAALFPGIDGFAQFLRMHMVYPSILKGWPAPKPRS